MSNAVAVTASLRGFTLFFVGTAVPRSASHPHTLALFTRWQGHRPPVALPA